MLMLMLMLVLVLVVVVGVVVVVVPSIVGLHGSVDKLLGRIESIEKPGWY